MININDYIFFGNYNAKIEELATMSPENWSFDGKNDNGVLWVAELPERTNYFQNPELLVFDITQWKIQK